MALKEKAQIFAIKKALEYMDKDPAANIPKLVDWVNSGGKNEKDGIGNCVSGGNCRY